MDDKSGTPRCVLCRLALDLDVDPLWFNPLARCDRSDCEHDSATQCSGDQFDRTRVRPSSVVAPIDVQHAISDPDLSTTRCIAN